MPAMMILALVAGAALAGQPAATKKTRPTLDEQVSRIARHVQPDGSVNVTRSFRNAIPWEEYPVDHIMNTPGLSNAERRAILGETAAKLLGISS